MFLASTASLLTLFKFDLLNCLAGPDEERTTALNIVSACFVSTVDVVLLKKLFLKFQKCQISTCLIFLRLEVQDTLGDVESVEPLASRVAEKWCLTKVNVVRNNEALFRIRN
jgi:hypothetical protein